MSQKTIQLKIVTPERVVYEHAFERVTLPTVEGEITVLPSHIALITALGSGDIVGYGSDEATPFTVVGGTATVENDTIVILADFAEHVADTLKVHEDAIKRAEVLRNQKANAEAVDFEALEGELERTLTRVKVADKWRNKKYRI